MGKKPDSSNKVKRAFGDVLHDVSLACVTVRVRPNLSGATSAGTHQGGHKVNPAGCGLVAQSSSVFAHAEMPATMVDQDLFVVTRYVESKLTDSSLLSSVPNLGPPIPRKPS